METMYHVHGTGPVRVVLVHGGPGAPGSLCGLASKLGNECGVLEPFQTGYTIDALVTELRTVIEDHCSLPVVLVGHSWGAWLSFILASREQSLVGSLVLVASGPFTEEYVPEIMKRRTARLTREERRESFAILDALERDKGGAVSGEKDNALARLGELMSKSDYYERSCGSEEDADAFPLSGTMYESIWREASELRRSGRLIDLSSPIACPVVAVHGKEDPHPFEGVRDTLKKRLANFEFHLLRKCGHYPWKERHAKGEFFGILRNVFDRCL